MAETPEGFTYQTPLGERTAKERLLSVYTAADVGTKAFKLLDRTVGELEGEVSRLRAALATADREAASSLDGHQLAQRAAEHVNEELRALLTHRSEEVATLTLALATADAEVERRGLTIAMQRGQIATADARLTEARKALKEIASDFDHEDQTREHQPFNYGGTCRACLAERTLAALSGDASGPETSVSAQHCQRCNQVWKDCHCVYPRSTSHATGSSERGTGETT